MLLVGDEMKRTSLYGVMSIMAMVSGANMAQGQSLSLDHVTGLTGQQEIHADQDVVFHIRLTTDGDGYKAVSNGFRVYSQDGAQWDTTKGAWTGAVDSTMFEMLWVTPDSDDGQGADTIGFAGIYLGNSTGLPPGFNAIALTITIGPILDDYQGLTICLDSSFYPPNNNWMWVVNNESSDKVFPLWDGPHCFTVTSADQCCSVRGDIDGKTADPIRIGDLVWLSEFLNEGGRAPVCMLQADVDGDRDVDADDLDYLTAFMFSSGPPPVSCPE
jgi:hypothetical protein